MVEIVQSWQSVNRARKLSLSNSLDVIPVPNDRPLILIYHPPWIGKEVITSAVGRGPINQGQTKPLLCHWHAWHR